MSLTQLWEEVVISDPRFKDVSYEMFSNMHRGRYNYGIGPEVVSAANDILSRREARNGCKNQH
jgi:hypothetical protein